MKTYIGIARDHSVSIRSYGLEKACAQDYNTQIGAIQAEAADKKLDTIASVVRFSSSVVDEVVNSVVSALTPIDVNRYGANGSSTRLYDGVGRLIELFKALPDANNPDVAFLIMAITDGEENASQAWTSRRLRDELTKLQATDRWTFTFRVPKGHFKGALVGQGFFPGNIFEWDVSQRGLQESSTASIAAVSGYMKGRTLGATATRSFYSTDLSGVSVKDIKANLDDISKQVQEWKVNTDAEAKMWIRDFCAKMSNATYITGAAFYELVKKEDEVQDYKQIMIRDRATRAVYSGAAARQLLKLPTVGTIQLRPGDHAAYDVYIQSTSVNRKLPVGTVVMYWPNAPLKSTTAATKAAVKAAKVAKPKKAVKVAKTPVTKLPVGLSAPVDYTMGYKDGYKHGRGKQKNLAAAGSYAGNVTAYKDGFQDGKSKVTPKIK